MSNCDTMLCDLPQVQTNECRFRLCHAATPVGALHIVVDDREAIHLAFWEEQEQAARHHWERWYGGIPWPPIEQVAKVTQQVEAYFAAPPGHLEQLPVKPRGTPFQQKVWAASRAITFGQRLAYGELARRISRVAAARAVGSALRQNPIALVVPCHRIVAASGSLGGYAGGLHRKLWLLNHEARVPAHARG